MNVFVLSTGRCGSTTFAEACRSITNYTAAHESERRRDYGTPRERYQTLAYPDNHIEVDNRLSWLLGTLDRRYGREAFYVHLLRGREDVAKSHLNRWQQRKTNIIFSFAWGILTHPFDQVEALPESRKLAIGRQYWDTVNDNIELFLRDKPNKMTILLEEIDVSFKNFWRRIGAQGDLEAALTVWETKHNASPSSEEGGPETVAGRAAGRLQRLIQPESRWIVVDDAVLRASALGNCRVLPFLERNGEDRGRPDSDDEAISELNRLRDAGATHIGFVAGSFWWLDHYLVFRAYLKSNFKCDVHDADLIVFDLQRSG